MDIFSDLLMGLAIAVTPINLIYLLIGAALGMVVGVIPGFGPSAGLAILLPMTFGMEPTSAIVMLAAIYYGAMYGGTITSILLNTPGESATVASTFDGFPLAKKGRAGPALVMQAVSSFVGGTVGVILITLLAPMFAQVSRSFGPPEYFLLALMGMLTLIVMIGENWRLGIISALIGFALGTVGVDLETGQGRYTFGSAELIGGIYFIPIAIGLFGLGELFFAFYKGLHRTGSGGIVNYENEERFWPTKLDFISTRMTMIRHSILGFIVGVIPGAGATIASLMAYSTERSLSKNSENFGKGEMAGLVAPETANNAASSGAMIPLLTLGIPGSASTAVLLAAFLMWGLRPGPLFMEQNPELAWGLIASMYLGNIALLAISIFAIPLFVQIIKVPYRILGPTVVVVCALGTFSVNASFVELYIMITAGIVGFFMRLYGFSAAALVLALVLGPLAEEALRQTLAISRGSFSIFIERPASLWIIGVTIVLVVFLPLLNRFSSKADAAKKSGI
ncbi:putative TTT-family transporter large permease TctA component (plasmid) [Octadecabacter antarcticus 307]|uniref:Putative TTT-family transporter large permease TctA component n=1 Tax=Octadecabacter antarcticus 307 TaxID=391626 RepID=M9RK93_9RHOB|nr:tripartite tricarboxylate transporter permease [Octadecabacter antarcticus]AGI70255.1 putative TTT-family transporter large permease TctA component [Octadecabacter antarcticus 307]